MVNPSVGRWNSDICQPANASRYTGGDAEGNASILRENMGNRGAANSGRNAQTPRAIQRHFLSITW